MHYQRKGAKWGQHKFGEWQEQAGYAKGKPNPNVQIGIPTARQQLALHERVKGTQMQTGLVNGRAAPPMPAGTPTPSDFIYRRFNGSKLPSYGESNSRASSGSTFNGSKIPSLGNGTTRQTSSGSSGSTSSSSSTKKPKEEKPTNSNSSSSTTTANEGEGGSSSGGSSRRSSGSSRGSFGSSARQQTQQQQEVNEATLFRSDNAPNQKVSNPISRTQSGIQTGRSSSATSSRVGIRSGIVGRSNTNSDINRKDNRPIDKVASGIDSKKLIGRSRALRGNKTYADDLNVAIGRSREVRKRTGKSRIDEAIERLEKELKSEPTKPKYADIANSRKRRRKIRTGLATTKAISMSYLAEEFDHLSHSYLED